MSEETAEQQAANETNLEKLRLDDANEKETPVEEPAVNGSTDNATIQDDSDDDSRKLFVGGLSYETDANDLKEYFSKWGKVTQSLIKYDRNTGCSRGFGFVTLENEECVTKVLEVPEHKLKSRKIDPKRAKPSREPMKKIFVGGIDPDLSEDQIMSYFSQYGTIDSLDLPFDSQKGKRKNYIFVCFTSGAAAKKAIAKERQEICGKQCDVRLAVTREQASRQKAIKQYGNLFENTPAYLANYTAFGDLFATGTYAPHQVEAAYSYPYYAAAATSPYDYYGSNSNAAAYTAAGLYPDYNSMNMFRAGAATNSPIKPLTGSVTASAHQYHPQSNLPKQHAPHQTVGHYQPVYMQQNRGPPKPPASQLPNATRLFEEHRFTPPRVVDAGHGAAAPAANVVYHHHTNGPSLSLAAGAGGAAPVMDHDFTGMWQSSAGPTAAAAGFTRT